MNEVVSYLESIIYITPEDLRAGDNERQFLLGQLDVIDKIKDILEKGLPNDAN